ncbi:hypothetical protein ACN28E_06800 [Archangium lansingense]
MRKASLPGAPDGSRKSTVYGGTALLPSQIQASFEGGAASP